MTQPTPKLLWSEEFDTLDLQTAANPNGRWRANDQWQPIDQGYADFGAGGGSWNLNPAQRLGGEQPNPFSVANSVLTIQAIRTPDAWKANIAAANGGKVPGWCGGELISNTSLPEMTFDYGYYEFRARWPNRGQGMFPAMWFFAAHGQDTAQNKGHAEIDLLEIFGYVSGTPWHITLHEKDNTGAGNQFPVYNQSDDTSGWHTYGLYWTKDALRFYHDGAQVAEMTGSHAAYFAGCKMSIRLNYAMDAAWFHPAQKSDAQTPSPLIMNVDYVRKYDLPPNPGAPLPPVVPPTTPTTPVPTTPPKTPPTTPTTTPVASTPTTPPVHSTPTPAPTPSRPPNDQTVNLPKVSASYGFSNNITRSVQALLGAHGFDTPESDTWTTETTDQVEAFQRAKGLGVTGVVDAGTWARLIYG